MPKKRQKDAESPADIRTWIAKQPADLRRGYRSTLSSLKNAYKRQETSDVLWWYEVGTYVREFFPESRQSGSKVTELLAEGLGATDDAAVKSISNTLWQARIIAKRLTKTEAKHWAKKRNKNGRPLSAYHVHGLVAVEDKGQRKKLLDHCLAESWSTQRLRAEVQNHFGKKKSRGGRTPKPREVPSPVVALQDIQLHARQWQANHKVWFVGNKSALGRVAKRQQKELGEELGAAVDALVEMQEAVKDGLACLEKLAGDVGTQNHASGSSRR
jgi:hypothetical protein